MRQPRRAVGSHHNEVDTIFSRRFDNRLGRRPARHDGVRGHPRCLHLRRLLDEPPPAEADLAGDWHCFERGVRRDTGGNGWANVWKRHNFAWVGWKMMREEVALYEAPFRHGQAHMYPARHNNRRDAYRVNWWRHVGPSQDVWQALDDLSRYVATPAVAKHRLFVWLDVRACPDHQLVVMACEGDTTFGVPQSRFHDASSLRLGRL